MSTTAAAQRGLLESLAELANTSEQGPEILLEFAQGVSAGGVQILHHAPRIALIYANLADLAMAVYEDLTPEPDPHQAEGKP